MKRKTRLVVLAFIIALSILVAAVAMTNKDILTATGQNTFSTYGTSSPSNADPNAAIDTVVISAGGTEHHDITGLQYFEAGGIVTYEADGFRLVHDTNTGVWHMEWDVKNNLDVPITIEPHTELRGCDISRTGPYVYAGASEGCSGHGSSLTLSNEFIPYATPSVVDGTHDSTSTRLSFQTSTLNIQPGSTLSNAANNTVGKSVRNKYLALHPEAAKTRPAANPVQLRKSICDVNTLIGTVNGKAVVLQPGESATIVSTVNSSDWGFSCSPVNHALINYNVQAGNTSYSTYKANQLIVFGNEESNICGTK
jgi:uncharacterized cupredoxin-like copper-binding protein